MRENILERKKTLRTKRKLRTRGKIFGVADVPRVTIFRSNRYFYAQAINDTESKTLAAVDGKKMGLSNNKENVVNNNESEVNQTVNNNTTNGPDKKGFAIAALVLGIIAIVLCCIWYVSIPCGIIALILGILGRKSSKKGMSTAGIVTGVIGMILCIVLYVGIAFLGLSIFNSAVKSTDDINDQLQQSLDELEDYSSSFDYDYDY